MYFRARPHQMFAHISAQTHGSQLHNALPMLNRFYSSWRILSPARWRRYEAFRPPLHQQLNRSEFETCHCELFSTASSNLSNASAKRRTPSSVSLSVTSFIEIPSLARVCMVRSADSTSSVRLARGCP